MRQILFIASLVFVFSAQSKAADSMAIFTQPDQTVVVINETARESKLKDLIATFQGGTQLNLASLAGDVSVQCKTSSGAASCTFRLKDSNEVEVSGKRTFVYSDSQNTANFRVNNVYSRNFENAHGDRFDLFIGFFEFAAQTEKE